MIHGKIGHSLMAQINKIANVFWTADPIAQMQYEYDLAVGQLKEGRHGLEQYRALVERVTRQVSLDKRHVTKLGAKVKAYLGKCLFLYAQKKDWNFLESPYLCRA